VGGRKARGHNPRTSARGGVGPPWEEPRAGASRMGQGPRGTRKKAPVGESKQANEELQ